MTNLDLLSIAKKEYNHLIGLGIDIFLHWVKAHCGIDYNEMADELAGEANEDSEAGLGLEFIERNDLVASGNLVDYDNTDIELCPHFIDNG